MTKYLVSNALVAASLTYAVVATAAQPSLTLKDQARGDGVVISNMTLDKPGYVVVHKDGGGKPGPVIGRSELMPAGSYNNVKVSFDSSQAGTGVFAMLHYDDGNGKYEFPGADGPVKTNGKVLVGPVNWK